MSPTITELSYQVDNVFHVQALKSLPDLVWLDSAFPYYQQDRYELIAACPYRRLKCSEQQLLIETRGESQNCSLMPFAALEYYLPERINLNDYGIDETLPFQGGAIGYLGYDLARNYLNLRPEKSALAGMPQMILGFYDWAIIVDHKLKKTILFSRNEQADTPAIIEEVQKKWQRAAIESLPFQLMTPFSSAMSEADYQEKFAIIRNHLIDGDCYQINFAHSFKAKFKGDLFTAYRELRKLCATRFSAFMQFKEGQVLSLSPERFLALDNRHVETRPIKGTIARSDDLYWDKLYQEILLSSEKNQVENTMIVDLLRNDLSQVVKPFSLKVAALCQLVKTNSVYHLESVIQGELSEDKSLSDLLVAIFPGGSITGAPKLRAMQIIDELEEHSREVYCGGVGYFSACGKSDINIAIRTLMAREEHLYCPAGGGIVIGSEPQEEYQETLSKVAKIKLALEQA